MAARAEDRRIQRTRLALRQALVELILEQGYESITVQEIIDRANVGRSTFYAHYLDKQQLLLASFANLRVLLFDQLQDAHKRHGGLAQGAFSFSLGMFVHAESHAQLYRAMVGKQSGALIQREIQQILGDLVRAEIMAAALPRRDIAIPLDVLVAFVVSACMGLLAWWLDAGLPCSPAELDRMFQGLTIPGLSAALST